MAPAHLVRLRLAVCPSETLSFADATSFPRNSGLQKKNVLLVLHQLISKKFYSQLQRNNKNEWALSMEFSQWIGKWPIKTVITLKKWPK